MRRIVMKLIELGSAKEQTQGFAIPYFLEGGSANSYKPRPQ
jgi:hypothetical protein